MRRYLIAGLAVWLPILATFVILRFILDLLDQTIALLPENYQPVNLIGVDIPGLGVVLSLLLLFFTGLFATNFLGQKLVALSERLLEKIPLVRSIYNTSKQVIQTVFASNSQAFRNVYLVEYPRKGIWSLAFQTGEACKLVNDTLDKDLITLFIPTTPNPTSGFLFIVPKKEVRPVNMSADEALKFIISLGMMQDVKVENKS